VVGKKFGRLTVLRLSEKTVSGTKWVCACDCGKNTSVTTSKLKSGGTKSCGCLASEMLSRRNFKHGHTAGNKFTPEYHSWASMITRCYNQKSKSYKSHGAKGVGVCDRWRNSFENFIADMGPRPPGHSLDRICNTGSYTPKNCRWATGVVQARNRSSTLFVTVGGSTKSLMEWCDIYGVKRARIRSMVEKRGMTYSAADESIAVAPATKSQCKNAKG